MVTFAALSSGSSETCVAFRSTLNGLLGACDQLRKPPIAKQGHAALFAVPNSRSPFCRLTCDGLASTPVCSSRIELPRISNILGVQLASDCGALVEPLALVKCRLGLIPSGWSRRSEILSHGLQFVQMVRRGLNCSNEGVLARLPVRLKRGLRQPHVELLYTRLPACARCSARETSAFNGVGLFDCFFDDTFESAVAWARATTFFASPGQSAMADARRAPVRPSPLQPGGVGHLLQVGHKP